MGMVDRRAELRWPSVPTRGGGVSRRSPAGGAGTRRGVGARRRGARIGNMHALTIEQVVNKRRKTLIDMQARCCSRCAALRRKPECASAPQYVSMCGEWLELQVSDHMAKAHAPEEFNDDEKFCAAVRDALELKQRILRQAIPSATIIATPPADGAPTAPTAAYDVRLRDLPWLPRPWPTTPPDTICACSARARRLHEGQEGKRPNPARHTGEYERGAALQQHHRQAVQPYRAGRICSRCAGRRSTRAASSHTATTRSRRARMST